jgi:hypothetical protein
VFECRSNWRIYIEELAIAIGLATGKTASCQPWLPEGEPLTPFEKNTWRPAMTCSAWWSISIDAGAPYSLA